MKALRHHHPIYNHFKHNLVYCLLFFLLIFLTLFFPLPLKAQDIQGTETNVETGVEVASPENAQTTSPSGPIPLILTVKLGKPDSDASAQEFRINSGETAFVQTSPYNPQAANQMTPAEKQDEEAYKVKLAKISTDISKQVGAIQSKQTAINNELYIAQVPALQNDRRGLQDELNSMQQSREKLVAEHTAKQASKPPPPPPQPPAVARGINITPSVSQDKASMKITTAEQVEMIVDAPIGKWVQVNSNEEGGDEVWAKVEPLNK